MNRVWSFARRAGHSIGRGLSISSSKAWEFLCWVGPKLGRGIFISCSKTWQAICWTFSNLARGLWLILTKTYQFTRWAVSRIFRGLWFLLSTTFIVFIWIVRELWFLLIKMVYGPKRALTIFVALVALLNVWKHLWGGVGNPEFIFLTENPTFMILTVAGIVAGVVDLILIYEWTKSRFSPKANLPVPVETKRDQPVRQPEQAKPLLPLPGKRVYSDIDRARALVALSESQSVPYVSQELGIPESTLQSWKRKYNQNGLFRFQMDQVIWMVYHVRMNRQAEQDQIEMKRPN